MNRCDCGHTNPYDQRICHALTGAILRAAKFYEVAP